MQSKIEYIPFHKNCKQFTNVGELEMTPEGLGCKINDFLVVMYYPCKSLEEMNEIQEKGFQLNDTEYGKGICMYRKFEDAIKINDKYVIFSRVTKGNLIETDINTIGNVSRENVDIISINKEGNIIDLIQNIANIDIIAFMEFED